MQSGDPTTPKVRGPWEGLSELQWRDGTSMTQSWGRGRGESPEQRGKKQNQTEAQRPARTQTEGHSWSTKGLNQERDPRIQGWGLSPEAPERPGHTKQPEPGAPAWVTRNSPSLPLTKAPRHRASRSRRGRRWPGRAPSPAAAPARGLQPLHGQPRPHGPGARG